MRHSFSAVKYTNVPVTVVPTAAHAPARHWQSLLDSRQLTLGSLLRVPLSLTRYRQANASFEDLALFLHALIRNGDVPAGLSSGAAGDTPEPDRLASGNQLLLPSLKAPPCHTGAVQGEMPSVGIHDKDPVSGDEQSRTRLRPDAGAPSSANSSIVNNDSLEASVDLVEGIRHGDRSEQKEGHREGEVRSTDRSRLEEQLLTTEHNEQHP